MEMDVFCGEKRNDWTRQLRQLFLSQCLLAANIPPPCVTQATLLDLPRGHGLRILRIGLRGLPYVRSEVAGTACCTSNFFVSAFGLLAAATDAD